MNTPTANETKKIAVVVLILVILMVGIVMVRGKRVETPVKLPDAVVSSTSAPTLTVKLPDLPGSMIFNPSKVNARLGESKDLAVFISGKNNLINGADAIITFDPLFVDVNTVTPGKYFKNYPLQKIDARTGTVKVMGFESAEKKPLSSSELFFTLNITAKKTGLTKLAITFQKGKTNLSTLVEAGTSKNLLGNTGGVEVTIE